MIIMLQALHDAACHWSVLRPPGSRCQAGVGQTNGMPHHARLAARLSSV